MFQRLLNQVTLELEITPRGPLMIKSGQETVDPTQPDMAFVRTHHPVAGSTVYLPGTGIKGAMRAHAERLLRGAGVARVCDPLAHERQNACKQAARPFRKRQGTTSQVFAAQCPICRTFGSLSVHGRVAMLDAYPWPKDASEKGIRDGAEVANQTERRVQVAIDRTTGQSAQSGALYDLEVVTGGTFHTEIHGRNVQLWQLGLLFAVLADLDAGDLGIGFGKARGLGRVAARCTRVRYDVIGACRDQGPEGKDLVGVGDLATDDERDSYSLVNGDRCALPEGLETETTWRGQRLTVEGDDVRRLSEALLEGALAPVLGKLDAMVRRSA